MLKTNKWEYLNASLKSISKKRNSIYVEIQTNINFDPTNSFRIHFSRTQIGSFMSFA